KALGLGAADGIVGFGAPTRRGDELRRAAGVRFGARLNHDFYRDAPCDIADDVSPATALHLPKAALDVFRHDLGIARRPSPRLLPDVDDSEAPTHARQFLALARPARVPMAGRRGQVIADPFVRSI